MTRLEFRDRHKHTLSGILLDGAMSRASGAELSLLLRTLMHRLDGLLGTMYDDLAPPHEAPPAVALRNGKIPH